MADNNGRTLLADTHDIKYGFHRLDNIVHSLAEEAGTGDLIPVVKADVVYIDRDGEHVLENVLFQVTTAFIDSMRELLANALTADMASHGIVGMAVIEVDSRGEATVKDGPTLH